MSLANDSDERASEMKSQQHPVAVGTMVYFFNENYRVYEKNSAGFPTGAPIWKEHWRPVKVVSETTRSWVLANGLKMPKKGYEEKFCISEQEIEQRFWVFQNSHAITIAVKAISSYELLKKVAEIINFKSQDETK